jgi:hypothetical protein
MTRTVSIAAALFAALSPVWMTAPAQAADVTAGSLKISAPWARATPNGASVGGGYLSITNTGTTPDRLTGGSSDVASRVEIHEMSMDNGVMKMRLVAGGLEIKPGETVTLKPGGYHVMFTGLKQPFKPGEDIKAKLTFEKAGKVAVDFKVEGVGAMHSGTSMPGMNMK